MAPRAWGKPKRHKPTKGEKKKQRKEETVRPSVVEVEVEIPGSADSQKITVKGISTDRIVDVKRLLGVHVNTCHFTNYSFSHKVRGTRLGDSVEIASLKPCHLLLVQEDYTEEQAVAHIRRLLDIVACTKSFGVFSPDAGGGGGVGTTAVQESGGSATAEAREDVSPKPAKEGNASDGDSETREDEIAMMGPPPRIGIFYDFFSFSHLSPPVQYIKRSTRPRTKADEDLFEIDVKVSTGRPLTVIASRKGFYPTGRPILLNHSLVGLLQQMSRNFDSAYKSLLKAFVEHNKFGNIPYGFRANTWLVPPIAAENPSTFPQLPFEDESWGGGYGNNGKHDGRPWAKEFSVLAAMPCQTEEERLVRDRKAFLLHNLFVVISVFKAVTAIKNLVQNNQPSKNVSTPLILHEESVGDLFITIMRDMADASSKLDRKTDGYRVLGLSSSELIKRNLLKGIAADENAIVHDTSTLGAVVVRHCGHTAIVKVSAHCEWDSNPVPHDIDIQEEPEGGANSLNVNSLRILLHKSKAYQLSSPVQRIQDLDVDESRKARSLVRQLINKSLNELQQVRSGPTKYIRWELGARWVQDLQNSVSGNNKSGNNVEKAEVVVEGLGKHGRLKSLKKKRGYLHAEIDHILDMGNDNEKERSTMLKKLLPEKSYLRLKESGTGLHNKSLEELIEMADSYYSDTAIPKLVADLGSLELSPVDGRTLTDFMHLRGLRLCSLGSLVEHADKLPHVQTLCIHEMVVRAYKYILQAVIAAVDDIADMALAVASCLNLLLGVPSSENSNSDAINDEELKLKWVKKFLLQRFGWQWKDDQQTSIKKFPVLRGLCYKVGLELAPRDYDMDCSTPFQKSDIISLVPVCKHVAYSSADARALLEASKSSLDKGKLDDAVNFGTKALVKMISVCGPYHRTTAGAYSLLAVVLYHTGDFNQQAAIYQQKALDINERELSLDHPDTMKSYGDLAVFYYRLQHTELAIKYVNRALYLLHLICGPAHPNTAATYINVAMMEEGLGNVHVALRYLQEALRCNQKLLGHDHIQTAASYHAIAIALSMMDAYSLSILHEVTCLRILKAKLGSNDLRTQDAAAWLEYFESKAMEQQEGVSSCTLKPDASISSRGHLSVSDLMDYIAPDECHKKQAKSKVKGKVDRISGTMGDEFALQNELVPEELRHKETASESESLPDPVTLKSAEYNVLSSAEKPVDNFSRDDLSEGWQDAFSRHRSAMDRKPSASRRPILPSSSNRPHDKSSNFQFHGMRINESAVSSLSPATKLMKNPTAAVKEKAADSRSVSEVAEVPLVGSVDFEAARKVFSYKEIASAPPGRIAKAAIE
ncbi:hypothetical protein M569_09837, partial [Genlisea aurea]